MRSRPSAAVLAVAAAVLLAGCESTTTLPATKVDSYSSYATPSVVAAPKDRPSFSVTPLANLIVNGSFEQNGGLNSSNSFTGWSYFSTAPTGIGAWAVQSGTLLLNTSTVPAPTDGQFAAFSWNIRPTVQILYQDVTIPASGGILSFDVAIENRDGGFFSPPLFTPPPAQNQQFRAQLSRPLAAPNDPSGLLMTLYQTNPGDPLTGPYHRITTDVSAFAGQTVRLGFAIAHDLGNMEVGIDNVTLVQKDITPPVITYTGAQASYTVDQTVNITCTATDESGIAGTDCANISAPAYTFDIGSNTISSKAQDNAGNVGTGSVTFTVTLGCASVSPLVTRFVADAKAQKKLLDRMSNVCDKVGKDIPSLDEQVGEFLKELGRAQDAGAISSVNAAVLSRLVQLL